MQRRESFITSNVAAIPAQVSTATGESMRPIRVYTRVIAMLPAMCFMVVVGVIVIATIVAVAYRRCAVPSSDGLKGRFRWQIQFYIGFITFMS